MSLSARLSMRRSVRMRPAATPPTPSVPSGPRRSALSLRNLSQSSRLSPDVPRNQLHFVFLLDVDLHRYGQENPFKKILSCLERVSLMIKVIVSLPKIFEMDLQINSPNYTG